MKIFGVIFVIEILHFIAFTESSLHTWGERGYFDNHKLVERKLLEYNATTPKNYTIIYRYYQNYKKPVSYIEINVNSQSEGSIVQSTSRQGYYGEIREILIFTATIRIDNTSNVLANLTIYEKDYVPFTYILEGGPENNKSLTYLYMTDAFPTPKPYVLSSIGIRQVGDELLHFESKNVMNYNRFPSKIFSYKGSEYLTYVRFSINSPTAMVLLNTTYIGEQEFNAVVYDLNREHFVANFSVFGIKAAKRPDGFSGFLDFS